MNEQRPSKERVIVEALTRALQEMDRDNYVQAIAEVMNARETAAGIIAVATDEPPAVPCDHDPMSQGSTLECDTRGALICKQCDTFDRSHAWPAQPPEGVARPLSEWSEAQGPVVWWAPPVREPSYIGQPGDSDWPGYHTHWTPHPKVPSNIKEQQCVCGSYFLGPDAVELKDSYGAKHYPKSPCTAPTKESARTTCNHPEGSRSLTNRCLICDTQVVDDEKSEPTVEGALKDLRQRLGLPGETSGDQA